MAEIDPLRMYMVTISTPCTISLKGKQLDPEKSVITLNPGWNWISYPVSESLNLETALAELASKVQNGDRIKSRKNGFVEYVVNPNNGKEGWDGSLNSFVPGQGYKYFSNDENSKTFTFPSEVISKKDLDKKQDKLVSGETIKTLNGESILGSGNIESLASKEYVDDKVNKLITNTELKFYCIEPVQVKINDEITQYSTNTLVDLFLNINDTFEIIPTSNNSIKSLYAYPGALDTYFPWLEGVSLFDGVLFDMNAEEMYTKWSQGNQGLYHVQYAQYKNCIFWSDNAYVSEVTKRTNYTLYYSSEMPLCYSTIPENTFKAFYLAYNVVTDPNWSNSLYRESFAAATWATQVFSYYGLHSIGIFDMSASAWNIVLPKDCRGLMHHAPNILNAGVFDAANVTTFGSKSGSWRDAFNECYTLKNLYIINLKVDINISWSPINRESINFIVTNAANTQNITLYVSPYTYYNLTDDDKTAATEKNITIALLEGNLAEDTRWKTKQDIIEDLSTIREGAALGSIALQESKDYVDSKIKELSEGSVKQQTLELAQGYNLVSFNVNVTLEDLQQALGDNAVFISTSDDGKDRANLFSNYDTETKVWSGDISTIDISKSYFINMANDFTLNVSGKAVNPNDTTITLNQGWNWIAYPLTENMSVNEAFAGFTPTEGDTIKSHNGAFTQYITGLGWLESIGSPNILNELAVGNGYMYQHVGAEPILFTYPSSELNVEAELAKKQDQLISGETIKTLNGESILGSGDIIVPQIVYVPNNALMPNPPVEGVLYIIGEEEV